MLKRWEFIISFLTLKIALGVNLLLLSIRISLLWAISPSYYRGESLGTTSWWFWLSPLADILAVLRIFLSAGQRPTSWRGRNYDDKEAIGFKTKGMNK